MTVRVNLRLGLLASVLLVPLQFATAQVIQDSVAVIHKGADSASGTSPAAPLTLITGTDRVIAPPKAYTVDQGSGSSFAFEDAPIGDVVRTIVGDVARSNFVLHPPITGTVTMVTRNTVSNDQAMFLLESALFANGLALARDVRGTFHVGRPDVLKNIGLSVRQAVGNVMPPGYGAVVVPLQYIAASEMAAILRPLVPADAIVRVDALRNLLVMMGSRSQAEGWLDVVSTFDVDMLAGMSVGVFPLKYASVKDVELALTLLNPNPTASTGGGSIAAAAPANPPAAQSAAQLSGSTVGSLSSRTDVVSAFGAMRIVPLEQINSVLVVSPRAAYLELAKSWIDKLDKPNIGSTESQLHVYPVQNGNSRHLAGVLIGLFGDSRSASQTSGATGVAPGLSTAVATTNRTGGVGSTTSNTNRTGTTFGATGAASSPLAGQGAQSPVASSLGGSIRVMSDDINNIILVWSTYAEFSKIEATLKRLDIPPTQVLIEASIIEVTLTDDLKYGLQWKFNDRIGSNGNIGTGVLSSKAGGVLGAAAAGFSYTVKNSIGDIRAVLNALAEKSLVKVISSPSLMVLDNHAATISVGNQQPIRSGETVGTDGLARSTTIQYKDTGVNLSVVPSVSAGNMVTMQVDQNVTDVGAVDEATGQRAFLQRQISSKVAVRTGETVVLGGLIRDNTTTGKSGIPLLQDLPLFGNLFSSQSSNGERTELLVMITPKVVRSDVDLRSVGMELKDRLRGLKLGDVVEPSNQ